MALGKKKMIFKRGCKNSGAFPSLGRDTDRYAHHGQIGAMVAAPPNNCTEKPFNPQNYVIDTAETVGTVSTLTNDRAFHSMKRFNCGFDYSDKNSGGRIEYTHERKNWYKQKKQQNQTYIPLRDNGSAFTAPDSSFGMSEAHGSYTKKSTRVPLGIRCRSTMKWLGGYVGAKSLINLSWRGKCRWRKGESGDLAVETGYSSIGSRSRSSSECSAGKEDSGKAILSSVCLTYCDDSGEREEHLVWDE
jgi:hypothetical protein